MSGSGISWAICKSAPHSRQITMAAPHHLVFYRPDALLAAQPTLKAMKEIDLYTALHKIMTIIIIIAGRSTERLISQSDSSHATTSPFISTVQSSSVITQLLSGCCSTDSNRPHDCCHLLNKAENIDRVPDIPYTLQRAG